MNKLFGKIFKSAHSGGYVLITAVSAVLLVSVASAAIISSSYVSLSRQIKSFDYMKSKYEAEGQIEALLGLYNSGYTYFSDGMLFEDGEETPFMPDEIDGAYAKVAANDSMDGYYIYAYSSNRGLRISCDVIFEETMEGDVMVSFREYSVKTDYDDEE